MKKLVFLFLFLGHVCWSQAQEVNRYMVYFADKEGTSYSVDKPEDFLTQRSIDRRLQSNIAVIAQDLPVSEVYVKQVQATGVPVYYRSRWLNAVMVEEEAEKVKSLAALPFVKEVKYVAPGPKLGARRQSSQQLQLDVPQSQHQLLDIPLMHELGYTGKGKMIAVLDDGFMAVDTNPKFDHLFRNQQLKHTRDFVGNATNVYRYDDHGTKSLSTIAVVDSGVFVGTAPDALFLLAVTEDVATEYIIEEYNWLLATEWADSLGADIITSSLGYTTFDDASMNHTFGELDGKTTVAARAANWATERGILVVMSAGNSRGSSWNNISTPADAIGSLAVGAVDQLGIIAPFSSPGPSADGRIKPDVVAQGVSTVVVGTSGNYQQNNGTSFSGPQIAGFAAGAWQAYPTLSNIEIREAIIKSADKYAAPDNDYGYGLPSFRKLIGATVGLNDPNVSHEDFYLYPNPIHQQETLLLERKVFSHEPVQIMLVGATGNVVLQQIVSPTAAGKYEINMSGLPQGLFYLLVIYEKGTSKHKLLRL